MPRNAFIVKIAFFHILIYFQNDSFVCDAQCAGLFGELLSQEAISSRQV